MKVYKFRVYADLTDERGCIWTIPLHLLALWKTDLAEIKETGVVESRFAYDVMCGGKLIGYVTKGKNEVLRDGMIGNDDGVMRVKP